MVRLKFAIFAVAVLVVWLWLLYALAPALGERAKAAASTQAARASAGVAVKIDERRREFHRAALKVASSPSALSALRHRGEPPAADKFAPLKAAALEAIPDPYRSVLVVALSNEHGAIYSKGSEDPVTDAKELNVAALGQAGAEGLWQEAFGLPHLFFSFPVAVFERSEPKLLGSLVLGAPLQLDNLLDAAAKEAGLEAIALLQGGTVISIGGQKPPADKVDGALGPGKTDVVVRGAVSSLAMFHFPLGTSGDVFGGKAPLWVGSRQVIRSTPFEVIGYASTRSVMEPLASYQRIAVLLFFTLLGISVAFALFIDAKGYRVPVRHRRHEDQSRDALHSEPMRSAVHGRDAQSTAAASSLAEEPPPVPEGVDAAPQPGAFPEEPLFAQPPADGALPHDATASAESQLKAADGYGAFVEDNQPTMAYPSPLLPDDAFASSAHSEAHAPSPVAAEAYPDATRVQEIPEELLRASARPEMEPPPAAPKPSPIAQSAAPNDEPHFREVFREFLATREKCGEVADGITYDRFAQKLRKNRDQLIEKYNCRTVRFQVYVKEGKAALKATPIKG
jgi:hypothetical protein